MGMFQLLVAVTLAVQVVDETLTLRSNRVATLRQVVLYENSSKGLALKCVNVVDDPVERRVVVNDLFDESLVNSEVDRHVLNDGDALTLHGNVACNGVSNVTRPSVDVVSRIGVVRSIGHNDYAELSVSLVEVVTETGDSHDGSSPKKIAASAIRTMNDQKQMITSIVSPFRRGVQ